MPLTSPNFVAGGNIYPSRFVAGQAAAAYWTTGQAFTPGQLLSFQHGSSTSVDLYVVTAAHTSGTFLTDLAAGKLALVTPQPSSRTNWATTTAYKAGDVVTYSVTPGTTVANKYICLVAHTSGTFATDLSAGDWQLFDDIEGGAFAVVQAIGVAARIIGVSMESTDYPPLNDARISVPGYAAIQGEPLQVYGLGECCLLELGGTVTMLGTLTSDSAGKGVQITPASSGTINYVGGLALQPGVAGEKIMIQVMPGTVLV